MDYQKKLKNQLSNHIFVAILSPITVVSGLSILLAWLGQDLVVSSQIAFIFGVLIAIAGTISLRKKIEKPIDVLTQAISYASNTGNNTQAPNTEQAMIGRELVNGLTLQVYNLASSVRQPDPLQNTSSINSSDVMPATQTQNNSGEYSLASALLNNTPTPIFGMDRQMVIKTANTAFAQFVGLNQQDVIGKNFNEIMSLSFPGDNTLESWLTNQADNSVVAHQTWERVRLTKDGEIARQFDMVVGFSSGNSTGVDIMVSCFDKTSQYNQDDNEVSFVALAVHELRTPLTIMRGYIEVFEDEVGPTLNEEMQDFLRKMQASAQQLTAFVGNILNVARVEENQLTLKLREEDITSILQTAISDLQLRANVHGKTINLQNGDNIPTVGADGISIHEVVNNLVDNAIKYSDKSDKIDVKSFINDDGLVQIDVQDYGIGIPASVMPNLFEKFHRSHKSKVQVGGTGLGLYLCKALIKAHGGNIWVRSKEGEGAIFSFTLLPYSQVKYGESSGEDGIIRGAHGWIKNHSLYRN